MLEGHWLKGPGVLMLVVRWVIFLSCEGGQLGTLGSVFTLNPA